MKRFLHLFREFHDHLKQCWEERHLCLEEGRYLFLHAKGKGDPNTYIQEYVNICQANQEGTNAEKLRLFPVSLKKKALEWYTQFPVHQFLNWKNIKNNFHTTILINQIGREDHQQLITCEAKGRRICGIIL